MVSSISTQYATDPSDKAIRRNRLRRAILECLERRELMAVDAAGAVFAPGTSQAYIEQWVSRLNPQSTSPLNSGGEASAGINLQGTRWTNPTGGPSVAMGDPARISWSIVPDGTVDTANNSQSNLVAFLDGIYGGGTGAISQRPWFNIIERSYNTWAAQTGLTFVYEAADDGAPMGLANRGVTGVRGDIRIGGRRIDGDFGTLAFNYYPNNSGNAGFDGDMIIDTADRWFRDNANGATGENRGFFNVLMHEAGHGIGLDHVIPINDTKLMEPNISLAFLGAQHDDILGAQQLYGDDKEKNNSSATATDLGDLLNGITNISNLSTNGSGDPDWFKFRVPAAGRISLNLAPVGQTYQVGPQGGTASGVNTLLNGDLSFELSAADGSVLAIVNNNGLGLAETLTDLQLPGGGQYFLRVTGTSAQPAPQLYGLTVTLKGIVSGPTTARGPRLLSVAPNSGEIFSFNSTNTLRVSPTELVLRFDGASDLDASTFARGIRITRAGKDGLFGQANDQIITPGYIGFGDTSRIAVLRFATALPDDLYRIEIMGADVPASNLAAITNVLGEPLAPRIAGTDRDVVDFKLELGAQVVSIVPQPVTRNASGANVQARNVIEVFFNDDDLYSTRVKTGDVTPNPTVVDPNFYQLLADRGTVTNTDDFVYRPMSVEYFPDRNLSVLKFASNIDELDAVKDTSFRLRIGTNEPQPLPPQIRIPATDPASTFIGANTQLGTFSTLSSFEISQNITNPSAFPLDFPGAPDTPGSREINRERKTFQDNPDSGVEVATQFYNFNKTLPYGRNVLGQDVFNSITEQQKARAREIFEFYGSMLGIKFVETEDFSNGSWTIVTGDLGVFGIEGGQGGVLAAAASVTPSASFNFSTFGRQTVVMDASESWNDEFGASDNLNKPSWFVLAMREIGTLLGFGRATELPPGTIMSGIYNNATLGGVGAYLANSPNPVEPVFPGANEKIVGKYLYRPDSRDIDMYRFTVGSEPGVFSAEIVAERRPDSSLLDSMLTLYRELPNGQRSVIAVNDNYFSKDSFMQLQLEPGTYYIGVSASGNSDYNPEIIDSGLGGVSEGNYQLRVGFRPLASTVNPLLSQPIVDIGGSPLDGDGDGIAGGVFDFWFNAAAPVGSTTGQRRSLFVDKAAASDGSKPLGSLENPYRTIQAAFAASQPGDVVRLVPNGGFDGVMSTQNDNFAFEVGRGGLGNSVLSDGESMDVPRGVTVMVDAGVLFKLGAASIGVGSSTSSTDRSKADLQVLGTPETSVLFTSYNDESLGVDTSSLVTTPRAGDWGGILFRNAIDRSEGRFDSELQGRFVNHVSYADMRYGGGRVIIDGQPTVVDPIQMLSARPTIINNRITLSASAAISADPDSFEETNFTTSRYQSDVAFTPDYSRVGPEIHGNTLLNNSVNGLFVKVDTLPGQPIKKLTVAGRWDDNDIVHVVSDVLSIQSTPGGPFQESVAPSLSVVNITPANVPGGALQAGNYNYRMTFVDTNGNEGVSSAPTATFALVGPANAIRLDALPGAGASFVARRLYRSFNNGPFLLVAEIDRSTPFYIDNLAPRTTTLTGSVTKNRARLDASLVIDPGTIIKLAGGQIVAEPGSLFVAEGTADLPIVFTSRKDDRFGASGTFDTNNDVAASTSTLGDWGGIYFGQTSQGSIDNALITFGGGVVGVGGTFAGFNAIEIHQAKVRIANSTIESNRIGTGGQAGNNRVGFGFNEPAAVFIRGAEPVIVDNIIQNNFGAAFSINAAAMSGNTVRDFGRVRGFADRSANITENKGPLFRGNAIDGNAVNGLVVRGETITSESVWDDSDIVHVVLDEIVVPDFYVYGGLRLQSSPNESLVVKLGPNAGFTSTGRPLDIDDRIGGTVQVLGTPGFPVVLTSIHDDTIGAGYNPSGSAQVDVTSNGSGTQPGRGDWRSIRVDRFSNDRNVDVTTELEPAQSTGAGVNGVPGVSQSLGEIAANEKAGDDRIRLGMTVIGTINNPDDVDVYSFTGTAGTQVWLDIDRTDIGLDTVIELIDSSGSIIAQSDNSFDESRGALALYRNGLLISANQVNSMPENPYAPRNGGNAITGTFSDFYSTNPLDAGMRLVLPGATGTKNTYFVRVRSSNIDSRDPGAVRADLQDPAKLSNGKTEGQYQLQVRIREMDEIAGTTVRYSDIRYATIGVELLGLPGHSPIVGEAKEPVVESSAIANALNLGNFGNTDRAALSVAGELITADDVDWFRFDINQDAIEESGLVQHLSTIIDVDYADGLGRPNTSLWLFYQPPQGGAIQLAYFGTDSNVADDVGAPLKGSDIEDLSRGSAGLLDAFIGSQELPSGTYFLAITSNQLISTYLDQFHRRDAGGNPLVRAEPVDSVQRISEDRFGGTTVTTNRTPLQVAFSGTANQVPYSLGDVPLFVLGSGGTELYSTSTMTGAATGLLARFTGTPMQDLAMRSDGTLYGSNVPAGAQTDANTGAIFTIDESTGTIVNAGTSGINTNEIDPAANPPAAATALNSNGNRVGKGINFYGLTYPQTGAIGDLFLYGVGSRGDNNPTDFLSLGSRNDARNYVYKLNPTTFAGTSAPQADRTDLGLVQGAGTQVVERGYINTATDVVRNATAQAITMSDASPVGQPALLPGDRIQLQTPSGNQILEWTTTTLSTTLVANTQPQNTIFPVVPTNFFRDGMSFTVDVGATRRVFEIDTGKVLVNKFGNLTAGTFDASGFRLIDILGNITDFEFDTNTTNTAANNHVITIAAGATRAQVTAAIVAAINNPVVNNVAQTRAFRAALLPGTDRISITGTYNASGNLNANTGERVPDGIALGNIVGGVFTASQETTAIKNPLIVDQSFINTFDPSTLVGPQTYDGATFSIFDSNLNQITFEFDNNNAINASNSRVAFNNSMTKAQLTTAIINAINNPNAAIVAALPGGTYLATAAQQNTANLIVLSNIAAAGIQGGFSFAASLSANTATQINPLRLAGDYGTSLTGSIAVPIEEYFTNLFNNQVAPTPSTPGAMPRLITALNTAAFGVTASSVGTRLVLTGATGVDVTEMPPMLFNTSGSPGTTPIPFTFSDTAATLNARLLTVVQQFEPGAILMNDGFVWLPGSSTFVQAGTNDRTDTPPRNARLSTPNYGFVTGLTMIGGNQMYAVSQNGDLFRVGATFNRDSSNNVGDFIETIYNPITRNRVNFTSLTAGPLNAENGALSNILFGMDASGVLYSFDTTGKAAFVLNDAQWMQQFTGVGTPTGIAFSNLDVNLWHTTSLRGTDAGHGVEVSPDGVRIARTNGGNSLYFGFENPANANRQLGNYAGLRDPAAVPNSAFPAAYNTYDLAGGAKGSTISNSIDLSGYSAGDKPVMYFNYLLNTENANANNPNDTNYMRDSFRVFVSGDNGTWKLMATNNSDFDGNRNNNNDEFDYIGRGDNAAFQVQELYDAGAAFGGQTAPNNWRQARIDLSPFAGQKLVRVRFDFDTGANMLTGPTAPGGIELHAVPGHMIPPNNKTFAITNTAVTPAVSTTFEFDFGLLMDIPSGGALNTGNSFTVNGVTYTFTTANNIGNNVLFAANESGATIAARIVTKLLAQGLTPNVDPTLPSRISVIDATSASATPATLIVDAPGVGFGNRAVPVHRAMTVAEVRDAMRRSMAAAWNPASQASSISTLKFFDRTIFLWNKNVINAGPLGLTQTLPANNFGVPTSTNLGGSAIQRNQNNNFEGVYIDDVIIGFAERGEMITGTGTGTDFSNNPMHEPDPSVQQTELGTYQIEVRRSASYGRTQTNFPQLNLTAVGTRSFDTNDRLAQQVSLVAPSGSSLVDGATFTLSDGVDTVTFEFDDQAVTSGPNLGVAQGRVRIPFFSSDDADTVGRSIRDAINSPNARAVLNITAAMADGTATGATFIYSGAASTVSTSRVINLHGLVSVNNQGGSSFLGTQLTTMSGLSNINTAAQASQVGYILHGLDGFSKDDLGDSNRFRDQGQVIVQGNIIRDTSNFGIVVDAGSRAGGVLTPLAGTLPHAGSASNLFQFNQAQLAPGPTITNNMIYGSGTGGILFSGDTRNTAAADGVVPFGRITNNTIVGLNGTGVGISVTDNASPTLLNNIVASLSTGVSVDASSATTVIGGMVFQSNGVNTAGSANVGSFEQILSPAQPLFVDNSRRNYYLANGSLAIDSSIDSVADRPNMTTIRRPLGIADSPIVAPEVDVTGQLRVDDPLVNTPPGLGGNVFKDRGAIDRSDFDGPIAVIQQPIDNDPDLVDIDRNETYLRVISGSLEFFSILLLETKGTGPDAATVIANTVVLTENGRLLRPGVDYVFGYSANSRTIRLTPLAGIWRSDSVYEITLQNRDGSRLLVSDGTAFKDGDKVDVTLASGGTRTFEFDSTPVGVGAGSIAVPFAPNFSPYQMAAQLVAKINSVGLGLSAYLEGNGSLMILGATTVAVTSTSTLAPATVTNVGAIRDAATNPLAPNRATSRTQFTIVMPDARQDFGDANGPGSFTLQASNGARHALLPVDIPTLALGQFADSDSNGSPSTSATGDDYDSLVELLTFGTAGVVQGPSGPAVVTLPAGSTAGLDGQKLVITDSRLQRITFEINTDASPSSASVVSVDVLVGDTAAQVAAKFVTAVNNAVVAGRISGIAAVANGATVSLGGTAQHKFDLSAAPAITRLLQGNVELIMPTSISNSLDGRQFRITDGSGNTASFEINNTDPTGGLTPVSTGFNGVDINLATATPATLAQAIADAINNLVAQRRLTLGLTSVAGSTIFIRANDEDGVTFPSLFNSGTGPVPITVVATGAGMVDAWIDWNGDGDFNDASEQIIISQPVQAGANVFPVATPSAARIGFVTSRFRLSTTGGLLPGGAAIGGEVEDHLIEIVGGIPPNGVTDSYTLDEDGVLTVAGPGVLVNDTDADSPIITVFDPDPLTNTVEPAVAPVFGTLALNTNGSFTYTPNLDFFGTDTFAYFVADSRLLGSAPTTVTITVNPINDAPSAKDDEIAILEDEVVSRPVSSFLSNDWRHFRNDPNENAQTLTLLSAQVISPVGGTVSIANDTLTFTPPADYNNAIGGPALILLTIQDDGDAGGSANPLTSTSTLTVNITPVNDQPLANIQASVSVLEDNEEVVGTTLTQIPGFATGIAAGPATAIDETTIPATKQTLNFVTVSVSEPTLFSVQPQLTPTGVLEFDTAPDQNGTAVVVVRLTDDGLGTAPDVNTTADQTFTIVIQPVNDAPEFTLPPTTSGREDQGLITLGNFASNMRPGPLTAVDEVGQTFTVTVNAVDPSVFAVQPRISATGTLTYQTAPDINMNSPGRDFRVVVFLTDDGTPSPKVSASQTFTVLTTSVNDAPVFTLPNTTTTLIEDVEAFQGTTDTRISNFATNVGPGPATATDETGQTFAFEIVSVSAPELFSVQPTLSTSGELTFKTAPNKNGKAVVIARLVDNGPFVSPDDNDSDRQTFTISITPINDAPQFDVKPGLTVKEDDGFISSVGFATNVLRGPVGTDDENSQTIQFSVQAVNPSAFEVLPTIEVDGTLSFKTALNANSDNNNFTVRVFLTDSGPSVPLDPAPNSSRSIEKTFSITVTADNDPPIPDVFSASGTEDQSLTIQAAAILAGDTAGPTVDELNQTLVITQVERTTALGGTVTPVFSGSTITSMVYRPASNVAGVDTFLYVVQDNGTPQSKSGTGTITIVLDGLNDAPQFVKGSDQTVIEDAGNVSINSWASNILAGPPSALDEHLSQTVNFVVVADKPELFEVPPAVSSTGVLSFKPARDAAGTAVMSIFAIDTGLGTGLNVNRSATTSFSITITPVNDAPVFTAGSPVKVNEDSSAFSAPWATQIAAAAGLLGTPATALDESNQVIDFVLVADKPQLFAVVPTISSTGVLTFTPAQNASGVAVVSVVARDRGPSGGNNQNSSAPQSLTITINATNDAPQAAGDNYTIGENSLLSVAAPGLLANDTDVDLPTDQLTVIPASVTSALGATVTINANGSLTYDPRSVSVIQRLGAGQSLTDSFTYQVRDAALSISNLATVSILVTGVDDAPVANPDAFTVPVGQSELLEVLANDTDIDSAIDPRTIVITSLPAFGTVVVNQVGVIGYTAGVGFRGIDSFRYAVRDVGGNLSNEVDVAVIVNNPPVAGNDNAFTSKNRSVIIDVLANDSDPDGSLNRSSVEIALAPTPGGSAVVLSDGRIQFTPTNGFLGTAQFSYFVKDDVGSPSNVAVVNVEVLSAWQNPKLNLDVNNDGSISAIDALLVINYINSGGPANLPNSSIIPPPFLDPSGDESVSGIDVLLIINYLNTHPNGEGEADSLLELGAPMIVTMVTPEQMVATVGPQIVREIEAALAAELEACSPWQVDVQTELATDAAPVWDDEDHISGLADLRRLPTIEDSEEVDDFFGTLD